LADREQLALLLKGVKVWNQWRSENFWKNMNLSRPNLSGADLSGADLSGAFLSDADLSGANLRVADLSDASLSDAGLDGADLSNANLRVADLSDASLSNSNLSGAALSGADLSGADLSDAVLSGAVLVRTQALATTFTGANLTGACLENWHINSETKLDNVICEYFYERQNKQERRPRSGSFKPGEFVALFQKAVQTVDLIFVDGLDWKAFFQSFQELRSQYEDDNFTIQAIERKSGGAFVIRLEVPAESDKGAIERRAKELYEKELKLLEERVTEYKDQVKFLRQSNTNLERIVETMANNQPKNVEVEMNFPGTVYGAAGKVAGNMIVNASPEKQSLAEAAAEIQKLLKQLEETNPTATEAEQKAFVTAAIPVTVRQRAVAALEAGGKAAIEEFLDNPYVNVGMAIVEGWRNG
jgi:uncharacterized protein YjbI with pentapeptide repeats